MKLMKVIVIAMALVFSLSAVSLAASKMEGKEATLVGEVVDPACALKAGDMGRGEKHKPCAIACAKAGQTLGIWDQKTNKIYISLAPKPGEDPNVKLMPYIAKVVRVKGELFGGTGVVVKSVEPL